jgi:hypothetical protein
LLCASCSYTRSKILPVSFPVVSFIYICLGFVPRQVLRFSVGVFVRRCQELFSVLPSHALDLASWIWTLAFWFSWSLPREELAVRLDFCSNFHCCAHHGPRFLLGVSATTSPVSRVKSSICARLRVRALSRESKRAPLGFVREGVAPACAQLSAGSRSKRPVSFWSCARA